MPRSMSAARVVPRGDSTIGANGTSATPQISVDGGTSNPILTCRSPDAPPTTVDDVHPLGRGARPIAAPLVAIVLACGFAACSADEGGEALPTTISDGSVSYLRRCGGCHGAAGSDQAAETLAGVRELSDAALRSKIVDGGGDMPGFGGLVPAEELEVIIEYVRAAF